MSATPRADADREFPLHGSRARAFARFERDFIDWLDTPDGRFAVWQAREPCWAQAQRLRRDDVSTATTGHLRER
ncbi:MAG: hypothetical protein IT200_18070 [Thermoleophilia bacterium]|nr:hypothetical protein [Thermoleophilia bacterium]